MFEHSIYEAEPVATPQDEGDLFYQYELKSWTLTPRIYKILGISAAANLLALLIMAQTSILTMKGCDSPLVGNVCQVLDTLYVGTQMFGTERDYVDAVYDKTKIGDSEEVTFVDVSSDSLPLSYPEGYFQLANPEQFQAQLDALNNPALTSNIPGIPNGIPMTTPSQGNSLLDTKQNIPTANPNAVDGELPSGFGSSTVTSGTGRRPRKGNGSGTIAQATPSPTPEVLPTPMTSDAVTAVQINKKPLADFADDVSTQWEAKQIDLNQDFTVTLNAFITDDGRLDIKKSKFDVSKESGDKKMINVGKAALQALGESGYLTFLKSAGVDQITAVLIQDDTNITVQIMSVQKTQERAQSIASNVGAAILIGKTVTKNPSDERTLLDGAQSTTDGKKTFVLNFQMPKPVAQDMINRALTDSQAKKKAQPQQPSSSSVGRPSDNTTQK
ncbi:MAG TPA: hypothetical protein VGO43_13210 [Pyrinomonadaceae bacterium]|jgi:hypothetical protein|nr:hypothetical protein [Pyrinomonadaceae bacterium]